MEVINILYAAARMLGIGAEVQGYFDNDDGNGEKEAETLLQCYNIVEKELALDYFPLKAEDTMLSLTGRVDFSALSQSPVRILSVKNNKGEELEYELFPAYLKAKTGTLTIAYTYTPTEKTAFETCEHQASVTETIFLYGTLSQYALTQGMYEEAVVWDKKYKKAVQDACGFQSCKRLSSRRWV